MGFTANSFLGLDIGLLLWSFDFFSFLDNGF